MPRIIHFEFQADDPERASKFFKKTFGWEFTKWSGPQEYWMIKTGEEGKPGINGGMMRRDDNPANVFNTLDVPSVDEYIKKHEAKPKPETDRGVKKPRAKKK